MKALLKIFFPLLILIAGVAIFFYMNANKPAPKVRPKAAMQAITAEAFTIQNGAFLPHTRAQGLVRASQQTNLLAEVGGKVTRIADAFAVGARVTKGQTLVALEEERYTAQVAIAAAEVTSAEAGLIEEQARAELALDNWQRSGNKGQPGALTRRDPQLKAARAKLSIARHRLQTARLDLAATKIRAPYDGVITQTSANLGQLVSNGVQLGSIMATSSVEVRALLATKTLALLPQLPLPIEVLSASGEAAATTYLGKLVRREVHIDEQTRQLGVIAEIANPFDYSTPLLPGQFVSLAIPTRKLVNVARLPLSAISAGGEVSVIEQGLLVKKKVELVFTEPDSAIVRGLADGELVTVIALTNLPVGSRIEAVAPAE